MLCTFPQGHPAVIQSASFICSVEAAIVTSTTKITMLLSLLFQVFNQIQGSVGVFCLKENLKGDRMTLYFLLFFFILIFECNYYLQRMFEYLFSSTEQ